MSKRVLNYYDKIILFVLGLFPFFTSCEVAYDYGAPYADYEFKGIVTDSLTNTPVDNAQVIIRENDGRPVEVSEADTVFTDSDGKYIFTNPHIYANTLIIKVEDIDGINHGGPYLPEEILAVLSEAVWDKSKAKGYYTGKATVTKNFKLNK